MSFDFLLTEEKQSNVFPWYSAFRQRVKPLLEFSAFFTVLVLRRLWQHLPSNVLMLTDSRALVFPAPI